VLFYATKGDSVVYARNAGLYGVMTIAGLQGDRVSCIVDGQVFGEVFKRGELRPATAQEKARVREVGAARACDAVIELEDEAA
jgi:hypothetical protein